MKLQVLIPLIFNKNSNEKAHKRQSLETQKTPLPSDYEMYIYDKDGKEIIVCVVGKTILHYDYRAINDLHEMLKAHGDWMLLGSKDQKVETKEGTVEHWGRSENNPIGGMVRAKKRLQRPVRDVYASFDGSARFS